MPRLYKQLKSCWKNLNQSCLLHSHTAVQQAKWLLTMDLACPQPSHIIFDLPSVIQTENSIDTRLMEKGKMKTKLNLHGTVLFSPPKFPVCATLEEAWEALKTSISDASPDFYELIRDLKPDDITKQSPALELLINKSIESDEYQQIKKECENAIVRCEAELKELSQTVDQELDIEGLADLAVNNLKKLAEFYISADSDIKRAIVSSIYPEKWVFDGETHRTPQINEAVQLLRGI